MSRVKLKPKDKPKRDDGAPRIAHAINIAKCGDPNCPWVHILLYDEDGALFADCQVHELRSTDFAMNVMTVARLGIMEREGMESWEPGQG